MKFLSLFAAIFILSSSFGQNDYPYGQFNIRNIDRTEYKGGVQNWDIIQNDDRFIYIANNGGIIEFNGEQWYKFDLENTEHPRSFAKNDQGTVFVGGSNEFGKISYDKKGRPFVEKLSEEVDTIDFKAIWKIYCIEEKTYFMSRNYIFVLDSNDVEIIPVPDEDYIKESEKVGTEIICTFNDHEDAVSYVLRGTKFLPIAKSNTIVPAGIVQEGDSTYVIDGIGTFYSLMVNNNNYKFERTGRSLDFESESEFKHVENNGKLIVSSIEGVGIQIFDMDGKFIRSIGEEDGLNNSIVRDLLFDQYENLWLCTDNGVSYVEISSSITEFRKAQGITAGATEDLMFQGENVILATHSDLFTSKIENGKMRFESKPTFGFETWQIKKYDFPDGSTQTLIIANDGIYTLDENLKPIEHAKYVYAWDLHQSSTDPNRIFIGLDGDGVASMYYTGNGKFEYEGHYAGTSGDVRSIVELDGNVYYCVKYDGVHLLDTLKEQSENVLSGLKDYDTEAGDQKYEQFTMTIYDGKVYVGSVHGLYEIEDNELKPSNIEDCLFCEKDLLIHRIINDGSGKLWIVMFHNSGFDNEAAEMGYISKKDGELKWHSYTFNQIKDDVIFSIKKDDKGMYWLGGVKAVYAYNEEVTTNFQHPFNVNISGVYLNEDEEFLYHARYAKMEDHIIDYQHNSIKFNFGANSYLGGIENEYSYYLEGEEEEWSKWKSTPSAEFQRLREGKYVFHLKARNFYGFESEESTFAFTITPPWYRTWWAYLIYVLLFISLIYVIIRLSIRRVKAQNERLEQIVEERTAEIAKQNTKLEIQKAEIEEKTNDILDSIKYAERIQTAILPPDDNLNNIFDGEHFVLYKPKDIVSGDFYWADRFGSEAIFAAVDCTGHGVPGAFVSIVGFNGLNRTVNEFKLRDPGEILDKLTDLVVGTFAKSESTIKDGMDIALCNINYETNTLTYAGANNPLIIIRDNEIIEIKANKQPIGEFQHRVPFETHTMQLQKGDCIYVYSDGYADQFGGEKGKKFKGKALKNLLVEICKFDMKTQHEKLNHAFESWKGDFEQLDDVCLFGVKI